MNNICITVTEEEIFHGLENEADPEAHCLCFIRTLRDVNFSHPKAWRFVDQMADGMHDDDAELRRKKMKEQVVRLLPKSNIKRYLL